MNLSISIPPIDGITSQSTTIEISDLDLKDLAELRKATKEFDMAVVETLGGVLHHLLTDSAKEPTLKAKAKA